MRYLFGECKLDSNRRELFVLNKEVNLSPRLFHMLNYLLLHHGRVVSKNELMDHVWFGSVVASNTVDSCISKLRKFLNDDGQSIRTVHGHGFIFDGEVTIKESNIRQEIDLKNKRPFVFVSYSHTDSSVADKIVENLQQLDIKSFLDRKDIAWGESIGKTVRKAIETCTHQIIILSPASIKSEWVHFEAGFAMGIGRIPLPFLTHPSQDVPKYFQDTLFVTTSEELMNYFAKWLIRIDTKDGSKKEINEYLKEFETTPNE
ncbi:MAG: winged helix-turn-helix domain-containing protein [Gammaproteobacteria bacterium]|nr:winged helix-turn-helix domain-containing protein [Gammaproteobacteria bacterium]